MPERYDAIIVGGGHNGLTCGAYLARAGLNTIVLERRHVIGGAAVTEEIVPGFRFSVFSYLMSLLHPKVIADFDLKQHGFEVLPATDMFGPIPAGNHIVFSDSVQKTQHSFARFSRKDADVYPEFDRYLMESVVILRKVLLETPPDPSCRDWKALKQTLSFLWKYRRVRGKLFRLMDLFTMSADDYLSEWFESTHVKAVLAYYCGIGTFVGPRSPGSAYVVTHHLMGEHAGAGGWGFIRGGMGTITQAIASYGRSKGLKIRTESEVIGIDTTDGRATGVTLADGTRIEAPVVASNVSAKLTFLKFLPRTVLPADFVRDVESYRTYSTAFKINIACERLPAYTAFDSAKCGFAYPTYTHIGPTIEYLERAYVDATHGDWSATLSSPSSRRASSTTRSARRASTSSTCSAATHRMPCVRATGRAEEGLREERPARRGRARARLLRRHHRHAGAGSARHRGDHRLTPRAHLSRRAAGRPVVLRPPCPALRRLPSPFTGSTNAAHRRIRAVAWAGCPATMRHARS
jgi:phytoene dehydrogenase-like protein